METVNVIVQYPTNSIRRKAVLYLQSGVVEFLEKPKGEIAHLSALGARHYDVFREEEPVSEPTPELKQDVAEADPVKPEEVITPPEEPVSEPRNEHKKNGKNRR
jgi:hypothetical protein